MNNLNSVLLEGQLVRDPEMRDTEKPECRFRISSNRTYKEDHEYHREVSLFEVVVPGRLAWKCAESLQAGSGVRIVGRLKASADGQPEVYIVAEHVEFRNTADQDKRAS